MARLLICTVGTSLLTNRDQRPWAGWNPRRPDPLPESSAVDAWLARADPISASAEANTLYSVNMDSTDHVLFLHSDTSEGRFCSERLAAYVRAGRCREARGAVLKALGYNHASFAQRGLKSLVSESVTAITTAWRNGLQPVFCATGGFKAEIAFLNLLGALLDVEVYYIHEQFRQIVRLPRLPLTWDAEYVARNRDFFEWIDAEPRASVAVESWLHGRPELRSLVEDAEDGNTYLNAAGNLLFQAARERLAMGPHATWPAPDARPPAEKHAVSGVPHHRPPGWERFVQRLCSIDCVCQVRYDETAHGGPPVKILDAATGAIGVRFGSGDTWMPLRVETTARGAAQLELVAEYLRHRLV